jgi:hypothetical protein
MPKPLEGGGGLLQHRERVVPVPRRRDNLPEQRADEGDPVNSLELRKQHEAFWTGYTYGDLAAILMETHPARRFQRVGPPAG